MTRALALAAAIGAATLAAGPTPAAPAATVTIAMSSHRYTPSPIYLAGGVPVRLIFVNRAGKRHDFTAKSFFRAARITAGRAPGGEVSLAGGRSVAIDLIPARGTYKVHCGEFGHKMLGMTTTIIVA